MGAMGISFILTFAAMEWVAWAAHRYLMHGPLWILHEDHHKPGRGFFERNDAFFLIFAIPSWLGIMLGLQNHLDWISGAGFGVLAYGITYVAVHEIVIHRRVTWLPVPKTGYWGAVVRAHRAHHSRATKERCTNFGLLWLPRGN